MSPSSSLLPFLFIFFALRTNVVTSIANPVLIRKAPAVALAIRAQRNATDFLNLVAADQARAAALFENARHPVKRADPLPVTNIGVTYTADIGVGSPPTEYTLIVDTGSSNTFIGADKTYIETSTSQSTGQSVQVHYGSGYFSGTEYTDVVSLSSSLVIEGQSIGVANTSYGFAPGIEGILGIGPVDLTGNTIIGSSDTIPTITDNLFTGGQISSNAVGIYYAPIPGVSDANGALNFGYVDATKTTSDVSYVPITHTSPASRYWGIDQSIVYGSTYILSTTAGIVDTGTTLILLATEAFDAYKEATGATPDSRTQLLKISAAQYGVLKNLDFIIGENTYTLTPNAQTFPRFLNERIGGTSTDVYLIVGDLRRPSGRGLDFVNGYTFLERYYTVYDTGNQQVGFATTAHTFDTTN